MFANSVTSRVRRTGRRPAANERAFAPLIRLPNTQPTPPPIVPVGTFTSGPPNPPPIRPDRSNRGLLSLARISILLVNY